VEDYEINHKDATVDRARQSIFSQVPMDVPAASFRRERSPPHSPIRPATLSVGSAAGAAPASTSTLPLHHRHHHGSQSVRSRPVVAPSKNHRHHRKVHSTADTLYQLTRDLDELNAAAAADGSAVEGSLDGLHLVDSAESTEDGGEERRSLLRSADVIMRDELASFRASRRASLVVGGDAPVKHRATLRTKGPPPSQILEGKEESTSRNEDKDHGEKEEEDGDEEAVTGASNRSDSLHMVKQGAVDKAKEEFKDFEDWIKYKRYSVWSQAKFLLFFVMLPSTGIASILFYLAGNPPCGYKTCTTEQQGNLGIFVNASHQASASWWLLFIGCRQVITLSMARVLDAFVIDYLALQSKYMNRILGPYITLFIVQAKGWPFILFFWCIFDFIMLFGSNHFANHWYVYS
jgi:hypothetical protein